MIPEENLYALELYFSLCHSRAVWCCSSHPPFKSRRLEIFFKYQKPFKAHSNPHSVFIVVIVNIEMVARVMMMMSMVVFGLKSPTRLTYKNRFPVVICI